MTIELGSIIKTARKAQGLTQKELASMLGVSTGAVQQWELGVRYPRMTMITKIENTLNIALLHEQIQFSEIDEELQLKDNAGHDKILAVFALNHPLFIEALNKAGISFRINGKNISANWQGISVDLTMDDIEELHGTISQSFLDNIQKLWDIPVADAYQRTHPTEATETPSEPFEDE